MESELTGTDEFFIAVDPQRRFLRAALSSAVSLEALKKKKKIELTFVNNQVFFTFLKLRFKI